MIWVISGFIRWVFFRVGFLLFFSGGFFWVGFFMPTLCMRRTQQWGRGPLVFGVGLFNKGRLSKERAEGVMAPSFAKNYTPLVSSTHYERQCSTN